MVSTDTSAAQQAVLEGIRGQIWEVGGPQDLTFNQLAALLQELRGQPARVRHIPRWLLRAMAPLHRQPRAALVMDTTDMTFRPAVNGHRAGATSIREALKRSVVRPDR
jgi:uncharacterized protein YbjT (DUF2867 family)